MITDIIKLMRPHQYIKNTFVFIGPLFSHQWDANTLWSAVLVFLSFCLASSAVYILNDIIDAEADRLHPQKKHRPLASGSINQKTASLLLTLLLSAGLTIGVIVSKSVVFLITIYFLINILYSHKIKHIILLDVFTISSGFMLRILGGTYGLDIPTSEWLLLCGLMITLFLGFSKRWHELANLSQNDNLIHTRKVLDDYSPALLELLLGITACSTIISYSIYTVSQAHTSSNLSLVYTIPFVVYGIFRYLYLTMNQSKGGDTAKDLATDHHLLSTCLAWICATIISLL